MDCAGSVSMELDGRIRNKGNGGLRKHGTVILESEAAWCVVTAVSKDATEAKATGGTIQYYAATTALAMCSNFSNCEGTRRNKSDAAACSRAKVESADAVQKIGVSQVNGN